MACLRSTRIFVFTLLAIAAAGAQPRVGQTNTAARETEPASAQKPATAHLQNSQLPQSPGIGTPAPALRSQMQAGIQAPPPCTPVSQPCFLTTQQKFTRFLKRTYSPYTFAGAAFDAGYSQLTQEDYGHSWAGFGKRYGANLADGESRSLFGMFIYASLFHQDPRYHPISDGDVAYRFSYAASRVLVGRTDSGGRQFNFPELLAAASSSALSNAYYPQRDRGVGRTISRTFGDILSDAGSNVLREFWPDIRRVLKRHEPERIQRMERKFNAMHIPGTPRKAPDNDSVTPADTQ
jgi:hypothetical protein